MHPHHILVLDDEELIREGLVDYFDDLGCTATGCGTGEEGLAALRAQRFALAVVDVRLPDMDGNTFMVEALLVQPDLRFIVHTGSLEYQESTAQSGIAGLEAVLVKPVMDMGLFADVLNRLPR